MDTPRNSIFGPRIRPFSEIYITAIHSNKSNHPYTKNNYYQNYLSTHVALDDRTYALARNTSTQRITTTTANRTNYTIQKASLGNSVTPLCRSISLDEDNRTSLCNIGSTDFFPLLSSTSTRTETTYPVLNH